VRILIAPDKFRGTLTALEAARAIERGIKEVRPAAKCELLPMSDGGDGFLDVLAGDAGSQTILVEGRDGSSEIPIATLRDGAIAIEMAANALGESGAHGPLGSSTWATGKILGSRRLAGTDVVVGIGGTTSSDGGTGAAAACGWRFLDRDGWPIPLGGGSLSRLARIEPPPTRGLPRSIVAACDVHVPLTGPRGAARSFAPQKGATPAEVRSLEEGLLVLQDRMLQDLGVDVRALAGAGAGGGAGAGLAAFFGAELRAGAQMVAERLGLEARLDRANLLITGEGHLDEQSLAGKTPVALARLAAARGVPCFVIAGRVSLGREGLRRAGIAGATQLDAGGPGPAPDPGAAVAAAAREIVSSVWAGDGGGY
jgi:glycerate kinase